MLLLQKCYCYLCQQEFQPRAHCFQKVKDRKLLSFFENTHCFHLCLLIVGYHHVKFQKNPLGGFRQQGVQGFGTNLQ